MSSALIVKVKLIFFNFFLIFLTFEELSDNMWKIFQCKLLIVLHFNGNFKNSLKIFEFWNVAARRVVTFQYSIFW